MTKGTVWKSLGLALLCFVLLVAVFLYKREWVQTLDTESLAFYYAVRGEQPVSERLKIVGYTENTLSAFADQNVYFPLPRGWHGLALKRLADAGAQVVVFDILFAESGSWDEEEDQQLADAVAYARTKGCAVILAAAIETVDQGQVKIESLIGPSPVIVEAGPELGLSNTLPKLSSKLSEMIADSLPLGDGGADVHFFSQAAAAFKEVWHPGRSRLRCRAAARRPFCHRLLPHQLLHDSQDPSRELHLL